MIIKLTKPAEWSGKKRKAGTVHDLLDGLANKLISRGLAKVHVEEVTDAPAVCE